MMAGPTPSPSILIVEPDETVRQPYCFIPSFYQISRVTTIELALKKLATVSACPYEEIWLSASFSLSKQLLLLERLKELADQSKLCKLMMVVSWSQQNWLPQTTWGGKISITHGLAQEAEVLASVKLRQIC